MLQPVNVAIPATADRGVVFVQLRSAPAGVVIVSVTELVSVATVAPEASCTVTSGWVAKAMPPVESLGCALNASFVAGSGGTTTGRGGGGEAAVPTTCW